MLNTLSDEQIHAQSQDLTATYQVDVDAEQLISELLLFKNYNSAKHTAPAHTSHVEAVFTYIQKQTFTVF